MQDTGHPAQLRLHRPAHRPAHTALQTRDCRRFAHLVQQGLNPRPAALPGLDQGAQWAGELQQCPKEGLTGSRGRVSLTLAFPCSLFVPHSGCTC